MTSSQKINANAPEERPSRPDALSPDKTRPDSRMQTLSPYPGGKGVSPPPPLPPERKEDSKGGGDKFKEMWKGREEKCTRRRERHKFKVTHDFSLIRTSGRRTSACPGHRDVLHKFVKTGPPSWHSRD
ncbi:MAG: hypothetical protein GY696_00080 [Gammaproteobacteria bacterium]|nr:hypothetical protein [Gammaproteobacteria bacterium]